MTVAEAYCKRLYNDEYKNIGLYIFNNSLRVVIISIRIRKKLYIKTINFGRVQDLNGGYYGRL